MSLSPPPHPITPYPNPRPCASFRKRIRPFCARDPPPLRAPSLSHATCRAPGTSAPHTPNRIQPRPAPPRRAPSHPQCPTRVLRVLVTGLRDGGRGAWVGRVPRARAWGPPPSHRAPLLSNPHLTLALSETPLAQTHAKLTLVDAQVHGLRRRDRVDQNTAPARGTSNPSALLACRPRLSWR